MQKGIESVFLDLLVHIFFVHIKVIAISWLRYLYTQKQEIIINQLPFFYSSNLSKDSSFLFNEFDDFSEKEDLDDWDPLKDDIGEGDLGLLFSFSMNKCINTNIFISFIVVS